VHLGLRCCASMHYCAGHAAVRTPPPHYAWDTTLPRWVLLEDASPAITCRHSLRHLQTVLGLAQDLASCTAPACAAACCCLPLLHSPLPAPASSGRTLYSGGLQEGYLSGYTPASAPGTRACCLLALPPHTAACTAALIPAFWACLPHLGLEHASACLPLLGPRIHTSLGHCWETSPPSLVCTDTGLEDRRTTILPASTGLLQRTSPACRTLINTMHPSGLEDTCHHHLTGISFPTISLHHSHTCHKGAGGGYH